MSCFSYIICLFFFFNDTATTEIYTLSLHDALPIYLAVDLRVSDAVQVFDPVLPIFHPDTRVGTRHRFIRGKVDRKSTRLNSSHGYISYAVFCLKKKKNQSRRRDEHQLQTTVA